MCCPGILDLWGLGLFANALSSLLCVPEDLDYNGGAPLPVCSAKWAVKGAHMSDSTTWEHVIPQKSVESPGDEFAKGDYDLD